MKKTTILVILAVTASALNWYFGYMVGSCPPPPPTPPRLQDVPVRAPKPKPAPVEEEENRYVRYSDTEVNSLLLFGSQHVRFKL